MNDLIIMSIQGGRYLEAERQLGDVILNNPSSEAYFMLGTTKSNLLLDKGRSYLEVQFCFNRCLELSIDRSTMEQNIMVFSIGLYSQLSELEKNLAKQLKEEAKNIIIGGLISFASSKIIDGSKGSFGKMGGIVGSSFGIGIAVDSISNIGTISELIPFVSNLKIEIIEYLRGAVKEEIDLLNSEILTLGQKYGSIASTDNTTNKNLLESLGSYFLNPIKAISMTKGMPKGYWNVKGMWSNKPFEIPIDDPVLGGVTSASSPEIMEFLFTKSGVYCYVNSKFHPYKDVVFSKNLGIIGIKSSLAANFRGKVNNEDEFLKTLNDFVSQMKNSN